MELKNQVQADRMWRTQNVGSLLLGDY
ncbi:uncharacterized protein G2W53_037073 [Senna tora]|uniref:Uncharacterized protein n=1 Tax=Senna tora TaxID=362788 RepID=A0A834SWX8_9FABA|nr:uncharacterized protein G2W53_037073 [Senna tora]